MVDKQNNIIESRLKQLGLELPDPMQAPPGVKLPFVWVRISGNKAYISGHIPINRDGSLAEPTGKVGTDITEEQAAGLAQHIALGMLRSLKDELGSLDRISKWLRVFGMVNCAPGFTNTPQVINGFSKTIVDLFGPEIGLHSRAAVGMAELPFNVAVEIEGEVEIASE